MSMELASGYLDRKFVPTRVKPLLNVALVMVGVSNGITHAVVPELCKLEKTSQFVVPFAP
jgi:hypothetical protein